MKDLTERNVEATGMKINTGDLVVAKFGQDKLKYRARVHSTFIRVVYSEYPITQACHSRAGYLSIKDFNLLVM